MSLQAVLTSVRTPHFISRVSDVRATSVVPRKSCGLVPVAVSSTGSTLQFKRLSGRCLSDGPKLGLSKHSNPRSHSLSSLSYFGLPKSTSQLGDRFIRLQTAALQAVTTDGDSSNGDEVGSSNHALNLSSVFSSQDSLVSSLQGLQEGLRDLSERSLQSSKKTAGAVYSRLTTGDGKSLFESIRWSEIGAQAGRTWQSRKPWIKWPIAIFAVAFLAVWISCGKVVAQDLVPLWIIGPLITGSIIRSVFTVADLSRKGIASTEPLRQAVMRGTMEVLEDAKKGVLIDKLRNTVEQKKIEMKQGAAQKWSDFVSYVKSGQAAADFKAFLLLQYSRLSDWSTNRYEDFAEWARPYWRAFTRLMKKLF